MAKACSPISMQVEVSSENSGLKLNPSDVKNALLRSTSATGRFRNSMRPGCVGVVMVGKTTRARGSHRWRRDEFCADPVSRGHDFPLLPDHLRHAPGADA